ncbi:efflux RND transporter permease subunit [Desulfosarcina sp. OttesenSCG-928-G10]|nr:efflux RND transporter permease subunit [Desulfosarcina sp. OttesenSCG-928-G10]
MSAFFIDRPIFAWVLALLVMLAGSISLYFLPVAQYPTIAPPELSIRARYPGASAKTVESAVTQIIEQQINGVDHLNYLFSRSDAAGQATITLSFKQGTDINVAQMQVQNKLQPAMTLLPENVQRQGLRILKIVRNDLLIVTFVSEDNSMRREDITDYVASNVQDILSRINGVGEVSLYGAQYAMRIWCDPAKLEKYRMTPSDLIDAVKAQNTQVSGGQVGALPAVEGQEITMTVDALSRLETVEQFNNILVRINPDGSAVRIRDVARIELSGENMNTITRFNGMPCAAMGVRLAPDANALSTASAVKAELEALSAFFPKGLAVHYSYDATPFVRISIQEVFKTLGEAIVLVFFVMFLFMQNFRATLIPTIAIPVVLLGTFAVLSVFGYSINTLTMFGMVLSIGLLVDDAIVVVENVERIMREEGLSSRAAAKRSMKQISSALVGITLVVAAVFFPMAFFGGSMGVIYRQFSITLITSMILSLLVALILTPALCATLLRPHVDNGKKGFFAGFNRFFGRETGRYVTVTGHMLSTPGRYVLAYGAGIGLMAFLFFQLPKGFLPDEDQGRLTIRVQLPPGASLERTSDVLRKVEAHFLEDEKELVENMMITAGRGMGISGQNTGTSFVNFIDWSKRKRPEQKLPAIRARAMEKFSKIREARVMVFIPPAVSQLGNSSGFDFELIDRSGRGHEALMEARDTLIEKARNHPDLRNVRAQGLDDEEQLKLTIDHAKAGALGVSAEEINNTIASYWGSTYINDFMDKGRTKRVYLQADAPFRMQETDFDHYYARNDKGEMVPLSAFVTGRIVHGSPLLERYNGLSSVEILGEAGPGKSTGQAMDAIEQLVKELPGGFGIAWIGLSFQEKEAGSQAAMLYAVSLLVIFLCLAALYESWSFPLAVMLVVPLGVLGVVAGAYLRGMNNDVYFQVGLLAIIGLAARNAILIVEFAKTLMEQGEELFPAILHAARLRFRPIIMTAMAFILGVLPLALSTGAGSGAQNAVGTVVVSGMLTATFFGVCYAPLFFALVYRVFYAAEKKHTGPSF